MSLPSRRLALVVCAVACAAACVDTSAPEQIAQQRSDLCTTTPDCAPGLFCVLGLCCSDPCGNALCGITSGGACDDGNPCTQNDSCGSGSCVGTPLSGTSCGSGLICDHGACASGCWINDGRIDAGVHEGCQLCDPIHSATAWSITVDAGCNDGNACTTVDRCNAQGTCVGESAISCVTADACHSAATCNPQTGQCGVEPVLADGTPCEGTNYCLGGSCTRGCFIDGGVFVGGALNPENACEMCDPGMSTTTWAPLDGADCDDGDHCTMEQCLAGVCTVLTSVKCSPLDTCHVTGTCDPATGSCSNPIADAGTPCDDGFSCSTGDACRAGQCVGDTARCECDADGDCPEAPACHKHAQCRSHQCTYDVDDSVGCSDQNACTLGDRCSNGTCVTTSDVQCREQAVCGTSVCDVSTGACVMKHTDDGEPCDGGACFDGACLARDAGTFFDADAGFAPDAGNGELPPVYFMANGCSSSGAGFSVLALVLMLARRRRPF